VVQKTNSGHYLLGISTHLLERFVSFVRKRMRDATPLRKEGLMLAGNNRHREKREAQWLAAPLQRSTCRRLSVGSSAVGPGDFVYRDNGWAFAQDRLTPGGGSVARVRFALVVGELGRLGRTL